MQQSFGRGCCIKAGCTYGTATLTLAAVAASRRARINSCFQVAITPPTDVMGIRMRTCEHLRWKEHAHTHTRMPTHPHTHTPAHAHTHTHTHAHTLPSPSICSSNCPPICLSICLSVRLSLFFPPLFHLPVPPSMGHLFVCPYFHLSLHVGAERQWRVEA